MEQEKYRRILGELMKESKTTRDIGNTRPVLAHYTSMQVVESILKTRQLWMSNPLNMNDHQEVSFGINAAISIIAASGALRQAFSEEELYRTFLKEVQILYEDYGTREVKDLYVACFSEHDVTDSPDGKLSMWRGYGNFGDGAAIVFETSSIQIKGRTPFILAEVSYMANHERLARIEGKVAKLIGIVKTEKITSDDVPDLAHAFFRRAVLAAVFTKHEGFKEEREWRLAYFPDEDNDGSFKDMIDYHHGPYGLEPKMKLVLESKDGMPSLGLDLNQQVSAIIIGPRVASPLNIHAAKTMLNNIGRKELIPKLVASTIPFRR